MKVINYKKIKREELEGHGIKNVSMRVVIGPSDKAPNFVMRVFTVESGGHTPYHAHPFEHEVFVLKGAGEVLFGKTPHKMEKDSVIFIPGDETHQFRNIGDGDLVFICVVPKDI